MRDELAEGRGLTVLTPLGGSNVRVLEVRPAVFTPNEDGKNEEVVFEFAVLNINVERDVSVELFDMAGRLVRRLSERRSQGNGLYSVLWDGKDADEARVPPGVYVARISVDSDAESSSASRVVGLVY